MTRTLLAMSVIVAGITAVAPHVLGAPPVAVDDPSDYGDIVLSMNPIGYWRLGEPSGSAAADIGAVGNDGTYHSVAIGEAGAVNGDTNTAARFDGSASHVEIGHDDNYLLDNGSLHLWFKFDANPPSRQAIWSKDANGFVTGGHLTVFFQTDGSLRVRLQSTGGDNFVNSPSLTTGDWHHVVLNFGTGGMQLYVDAALAGTNPYTGGLGTSSGGAGNHEPIAIGANTWNSNTGSIYPLGEYFDGVVDEVALFAGRLTQAQVARLYSVGLVWYETTEDAPLSVAAGEGVLANDFDSDGDAVTAVHTGGPGSAQSFSLNPDGSFSYTPAADYFGTDSFRYVADDGGAVSDTATVSIVVTPVNDPPTVANELPDTTVQVDSEPVRGYRDLNDVFADDEDGGALTFTVESNDNPGLVDAAIGPAGTLDFEVTPGQFGSAQLVVRATDSGALFTEDTMTVYVDGGLAVWSVPSGEKTVLPGDPARELLSLFVANLSAEAETLATLDFSNTALGPGSQAELDASFSQITLVARDGDPLLPGGSSGPATAAFAGGSLSFSGLAAPIAVGDTLRIAVEGGASVAARDGDVLDLALPGAGTVGFTRSVEVNGTFPVATGGGFAVDGMTAAQITVHTLGSGTLSSGSSNGLALDVTLPANGYEDDTLERLNVVNSGTAVDTVDVVAVRAWVDDGDGAFDPRSDALLQAFSWTGARWELTGLSRPVPAGGLRVFVTVDIADNPTEGRTVQLSLPTLPDVGVGMAGENDGPIDAAVANPTTQVISTADRVVLSAAPVGDATVRPGERGVAVLALRATNNYAAQKTLTRLTVTNVTVPAGVASQDQLDASFDNVQLREDANDNGVLDDPATDPVVGTGVFGAGEAEFAGLDWILPPSGSRYLFLTADVPLADARDGDRLDVAVAGVYDAAFLDATTVIADWPANSAGRATVDGMVAEQIVRRDITSAALSPGDGPVLALDVLLPGDGYAGDVLNALSVENRGTAQSADIADLRLWRDGGDDAFDAGAGDDAEMGQLVWTGSSWTSVALSEPLSASGTRVYVGVTAAGLFTDSTTVRLAIPRFGVEVASANDGPIDSPVENAQTLLLSTAPILASLDVQPAVSTVGQNVTVTMTVENAGGERINNVRPLSLVTSGSASFTVVSGPSPPQLNLDVGVAGAITWVLSSNIAGDATWSATAEGIGVPSGATWTSLEAASNLHRVFDNAYGVEMYAIESMPFLISRGQTGVVPLSFTFTAPGGTGVSQARIRGLRVRLEDGQGGGIVPSSLLSRAVVGEGNTIYRDKSVLETGGDEIDLTFATPAVIPVGQPVTLSLRLDILAGTVVPDFRVVVPDSAWITAEDAISGAPVNVALQQEVWPVRSGLGRVTAAPTRLDVDTVALGDTTAGWGQAGVEVTTLRLTNPGVAGVTSDAAASSVRVCLEDDQGTPVASPALVVERLRVLGPLGTYHADVTPSLQDSTLLDIVLLPLVEVGASAPVDLVFLADVADGAPTGSYRLNVVDPSRFDARNANTGESLPVVFASDPLAGRLVTVEAPAETLEASGTAAFPATVLVGEAGTHALTLHLRHPSPAGTARIRVDAITLSCQNEVRNSLTPSTYLAGVTAVAGGVEVGSAAGIPSSGNAVTVPVGGVLLAAGETADVEVFVDISATAPMSYFELTVEALGGIDAADLNTGTAVAVSGQLPATSGLTRLMPPPSKLLVGLESEIPAALVPGESGVDAAVVSLTNTAASGSGPITLEHLVVLASDGSGRAVAAGGAAAAVEVVVDDVVAGRSDTLGVDSTTAFIGLDTPLVIQPQETLALRLRVDLDAGPSASSVRFGVDSSGVGIRQPQSAVLMIDVEADDGASFPLWTEAGSFNQPSLTGSYSNYPNPFAAGRESTRFVYYLPDDATVNLVIWSVRGERVTTIRGGDARPAGLYQDDVWDGRNGKGTAVQNGVYIAELRVSYAGGGSERLLRKVAVVR